MSHYDIASVDALIRLAILRACKRAPATSPTIAKAVERDTHYIVSNSALGNMASRLHRAGWLTYEGGNGAEHVLTDKGREVLKLLGGRG